MPSIEVLEVKDERDKYLHFYQDEKKATHHLSQRLKEVEAENSQFYAMKRDFRRVWNYFGAEKDAAGHWAYEGRSRRSKRFPIKPMSTEEAILQMNLFEHEFFVFRDEQADGAISVVYCRKNGGYGLISDDAE